MNWGQAKALPEVLGGVGVEPCGLVKPLAPVHKAVTDRVNLDPVVAKHSQSFLGGTAVGGRVDSFASTITFHRPLDSRFCLRLRGYVLRLARSDHSARRFPS